ncbi:MAG TPA: hypothetical protein VEI95_00410 [Acidobacteriota bacterium]|nr:hypothetical protein [Acidobacteriota bacterium]
MQELDIEQRFHLMQKEIEAAVSLLKEAKLDLTATVDSLKIEIEALKTFMKRHHPGFAEAYPKLKEEAIQAIDPEWMAATEERKQ